MHEVYPLSSMKAMLEEAAIQEMDSQDYEVSSVLKIVLADLELMKTMAEDIRKEADEDDLYDVVSRIESQLEDYSKTIWFLKAMIKDRE